MVLTFIKAWFTGIFSISVAILTIQALYSFVLVGCIWLRGDTTPPVNEASLHVSIGLLVWIIVLTILLPGVIGWFILGML